MNKKIFLSVVGVIGLGVLSWPISQILGNTNAAAEYLKTKPLSPWTIMALEVAGEKPSLESLKSGEKTKAIDYEVPILALTSAKKDPRNFSDENYVSKLLSFYDGTQMGEASILNDDIFGLLALVSAGEPASGLEITGLKNFILSKQNSDGGFSFAVGGESDTNTTSAAIMALRSAGVSASEESVTKAISYLRLAQNSDGGFPYDPKSQWGTDSDASSNAWAIMAIRSAGENPTSWAKDGGNPISNLERLQTEAGYFLYQWGSSEDSFTPIGTAYALIALNGKSLPVATITPEAPAKVNFSWRIEGKDNNFCFGESKGVTAMDAIESAKELCGIEVKIKHASFGDYVEEINGEKAEGMSGWMYFVNSELPSVGASAYKLKSNDSVLWYFGDYGVPILEIALDKEVYESSGSVTGKVTQMTNGKTEAVSGAKVKAVGRETTTDSSGSFSIALSEGRHEIYAEKDGTVRSRKISVTLGSTGRTEVSLELTVPGSGDTGGGNNGGGSAKPISITIETAGASGSLAFGNVSKGSRSEKSLVIKNDGTEAVNISSSVSGDAIFRNYLKLNNRSWRMYGSSLNSNTSTTTSISVVVPSDVSPGRKEGIVTFWATPAAQ